MSATATLHNKCRNSAYPRSDGLHRAIVPDDFVDWRVPWPEYNPTTYTSPKLHGMSWADPDIQSERIVLNFNQIDGKVDRTSFMGLYQLDKNGIPINPRGRTGVMGRGSLGRWGPNHAADPIVTRWKTDSSGSRCFDPITKRFILQFVAIQRGDCGEWAIPGGMVDAGEQCTQTLKREFAEEALNSLEADSDELQKMVNEFLSDGTEVYKGYVDDPRNTDNSWMETIVMNFHDEKGDRIGTLPLHAGDDAKNVCWMDIDSELKLYASHSDFLELVAKLRSAKW